MTNYFKDNLIRKFFIFGVFLFSISLLLPLNVRNIPTIIFAFVLISFSTSIKFSEIIHNKLVIINTIFFATMLISLFYSKDLELGFKRILVLMPLVIMPLSFYVVNINSTLNRKKFLLTFYLIYFISTVLFLVGVLIHNYINGYLNKSIFIHFAERLNIGYDKYSFHPIYISIYISIALIFSIAIIKDIKNKVQLFLVAICIIFLAFILLMLGRKGPIIVIFLIFLFYFFKRKNQKKIKLFFALALISLFFVAYNIDPLKRRFIEFFNVLLNNNQNIVGSTSLRLYIFDCSFENIKKSLVFGYGIGDTKYILNQCYSENYNIFKGQYYNSHNQYLSAWLSSGILGAASLVTMLYYNLLIAIKNKNFINGAIIFLFIVLMFTENILERQDGVMLFSFFINFFAFQYQKKRTDK